VNYKQLMEAKELALPLPFSVTANDTCPAALFQYVPDGGMAGRLQRLLMFRAELTVTVGAAVPAGTMLLGHLASLVVPLQRTIPLVKL